MSYMSRDQRGFTLIEMSIVLVIIGLIVGGILKGQEVIESARQKNMASMYDQIRAAQNTFLDRYRALPGDYTESATKIHSNVVGGDGNGFVDTGAAGPVTTIATLASVDGSQNENFQYFQGLIASGLFGGGQVIAGTAATSFSGGATASPLPAGPWTSSGLTVAHGTHPGPAAALSPATAVWLRLSTFGDGTVTADDTPLTPASGFQFDQKFDDGLPASGRIRNLDFGAAGCGSSASNAYVVTNNNDRTCNIILSTE